MSTKSGYRHNPGLARPRVACDDAEIPRTLEGNGEAAGRNEAALLGSGRQRTNAVHDQIIGSGIAEFFRKEIHPRWHIHIVFMKGIIVAVPVVTDFWRGTFSGWTCIKQLPTFDVHILRKSLPESHGNLSHYLTGL